MRNEAPLEQLACNAAAYAKDESHFDMVVQRCACQRLSESRCRVYCLEQLWAALAGLNLAQARQVRRRTTMRSTFFGNGVPE